MRFLLIPMFLLLVPVCSIVLRTIISIKEEEKQVEENYDGMYEKVYKKEYDEVYSDI